MKSTKTHVKLIWFRIDFIRQFMSFLLLVGFLNTALFPSVLVFHKQVKADREILCDAQLNTSLAEYLLEDCLEIYDPTPDSQEEDVNNLEKFYDEMDLLNPAVTHEYFSFHTENRKLYFRCYCPLVCSCYSSSTPPPELCYV